MCIMSYNQVIHGCVWVSSMESQSGSSGYDTARNWLDGMYGTTQTKIKYPVFMPVTYGMNYISVNSAYKISKALTETGNIYGLSSSDSDTHLMKNSEWGAVAYLAQSKYGLDGEEIKVNNANLNCGYTSGKHPRTVTQGQTEQPYSVFTVTGCTSNETDRGEVVTNINKLNSLSGNTGTVKDNAPVYVWNQKNGEGASTTRTMYGVYDLSGGSWESMASYISNGKGLVFAKALLDENHVVYTSNTVQTNTGNSTKYVTMYPYSDPGTDGNVASSANFASNTSIFGDAIRETTDSKAGTNETGFDASAWNGDSSLYPSLSSNVFRRGGIRHSGILAGLYSYTKDNCGFAAFESFRTVLINK